jgi:hypothetical protein
MDSSHIEGQRVTFNVFYPVLILPGSMKSLPESLSESGGRERNGGEREECLGSRWLSHREGTESV